MSTSRWAYDGKTAAICRIWIYADRLQRTGKYWQYSNTPPRSLLNFSPFSALAIPWSRLALALKATLVIVCDSVSSARWPRRMSSICSCCNRHCPRRRPTRWMLHIRQAMGRLWSHQQPTVALLLLPMVVQQQQH